MAVAFKPEPSLHLTLRFILNSGFLCSSLTVTTEKQALVVPGLLVLILRGSYKTSFYLNETKG